MTGKKRKNEGERGQGQKIVRKREMKSKEERVMKEGEREEEQ